VSVSERLMQLRNRGVHCEASGGRLAVWPVERLAREDRVWIKAHREAILDWLRAAACPGWGAVPPELPMPKALPPLPTREERRRLLDFIGRQPAPVQAWVGRRAAAYRRELREGADHAEALAALDLACWQMRWSPRHVLAYLEAAEEPVAVESSVRVFPGRRRSG